MAEITYGGGTDLSLIQSKKAAIIGYGSQGHVHALNLKDSGVDVVVGLHLGPSSWAKAEAAGLEVKDMAEVVAEGDVVSVLLPDQVWCYVYTGQTAPSLEEGVVLLFTHGFSIRYGYIEVPEGHDVVMVALKGSGHKIRGTYIQGKGTPDVVVVEVDTPSQIWDLVLSYAKATGDTRVGVIKTTFTEETETDLFGEQAVLCSGVSHPIRTGFETLVEAGYQPEIAYLEACHEMKQTADFINEGGTTKQRWSCSDTAEYGNYVSGPRIISESSKEVMKAVLADIQDGTLARKFIADWDNGVLEFKALRAKEEAHSIEKTGQKPCKAFGWTDSDEDYTEGSAVRRLQLRLGQRQAPASFLLWTRLGLVHAFICRQPEAALGFNLCGCAKADRGPLSADGNACAACREPKRGSNVELITSWCRARDRARSHRRPKPAFFSRWKRVSGVRLSSATQSREMGFDRLGAGLLAGRAPLSCPRRGA